MNVYISSAGVTAKDMAPLEKSQNLVSCDGNNELTCSAFLRRNVCVGMHILMVVFLCSIISQICITGDFN